MTVQDYLTEEIIVSGLPTSRGMLIREWHEQGVPEERINMWFLGFERYQKQMRKAAA